MWTALVFFLLMNTVAAIHAWKFTHFSDEETEKSTTDENGLWLALTGISNPRPVNSEIDFPYEQINIESNVRLECWKIPCDSSIGTAIVYHGYAGSKSSMSDKAIGFHELGYTVLLVDFMGSGGSEGNETTLGYYEAEEVKSTYDYVAESGEQNIVLFGTSMGAVAIMKSISDHGIEPAAVILECPFGTLYETVCSRFDLMGLPSFPMAGLLTFWGGAETGFWAFEHEPTEYAKSITCPVLLLYGEKDPKVSRGEIDAIYNNLNCKKKLVTFPEAGHENYLNKYSYEWGTSVKEFLGL